MKIRQATLSDLSYIVSHWEGMFRDMQTPADFPAMAGAFGKWLTTAIPRGDYIGFLAETDQGTVVACAGVVVFPWPPGPHAMDPRCACVFNVYTDHSHRMQGLATRLMDAAHSWCRAQGIERVILNASRFGLPIYESMGYVVVDEPMMRLKL